MTNITTLSNLAVVSYLEDDITNIPLTQSVGTYLPTTPTPTINAETGFRALSVVRFFGSRGCVI